MATTTVPNPPGAPNPNNEPVIMPTLLGIGYGNYNAQPNNFYLSFLIHIIAIVGILLASKFLVDKAPEIRRNVVELIDPSGIILPPAPDQSGGGGGGGDQSKLEVSRGKPPKFDLNQITPPQVVPKNPDPKLAVEQAVAVPPIVKMPTSQSQVGDPLSQAMIASNGLGSLSGVGSGSRGGVGSGSGRGLGPGSIAGTGGGVFRVGGGVSAPVVIYKPEPEYSEEARKVKHQGVVLLQVIVGADGRPREMRVVRPLGMGLDEKALDAVKTWRFEPAKKDGVPVAVVVNIEVGFNLY
jgi:periplasmic protein TonB